MRTVRQAIVISLAVTFVAMASVTPTRPLVGCEGEATADKDQALEFWCEIAFQAGADLVLRHGSPGEAISLPRSQRWYLHVEGDGPTRLKTLSSLEISFVIVYLKPARVVAIGLSDRKLERRSDIFTFDAKYEYLICQSNDLDVLKDAGFSLNETRVFRVLPRALVEQMRHREMEYAIRMGKGDLRSIQATVLGVKSTSNGYQVVVKDQEYR